IVKTSSGVESAEAQTPMTELTKILAAKAPMGKSRINLAAYPQESLLYVGYLLKAFLEVQGAVVNGSIVKGIVKSDAKLVYQHQSSKSLDQVVQAMLKFSTNFIANQLFLVIGAEKMGAPANLQKSQKVFAEFFSSKIGLKNFHIEEGSGISRENQMSPQQQVKLLKYFEKYKNLLPEKLDSILAKTGTLNGVSCLSGYFNSTQYGEVRFSILLNQAGAYREKIAKILYGQLH
ncbi:MAG: D-alanyl-D-alanine carboxypeptidase, partial [Deltaproteobacteria bacterium]|nr:D-alanyl-D-alanine carboxypeptidase [Deltaproteobacteria bacterium]